MKAIYVFRAAQSMSVLESEFATRITVTATSIQKARKKAIHLSGLTPEHLVIQSITEIQED